MSLVVVKAVLIAVGSILVGYNARNLWAVLGVGLVALGAGVVI